jgi:Zn-dependent protease with chaperone function
MKHRLWLRTIAVLLTAYLGTYPLVLAAVEPQLPNPGTVPGVTRQQQEQLGLKAMGEVYKQMPVLPDSNPVTQYVQQLGQKLTAVIPPQYSWPYQFHVVPEKEINAFALPGGPIFINLGTIEAARNEAELAGVMGHEMSHVYMQHSAKAAKKESVPGAVVSILGGVLGAYGGALGSLASMGIQVGAGAVFMKYSRADEAQADAVGAIIMYKAGYNPQAMADFFNMLEQQGGSGGPQFLSDHPNPGNREAAIQKEIQDWPPKTWVQDSPEFQQAKNDIKSIRVYTAKEIAQGAKQDIWARQNSRAGATPGNLAVASGTASGGTALAISAQQVTPSSKYAQLKRAGFRIAYPDNWQTYGNSQAPPVTIAPRGGLSQNAVGYGVLINQYRPNPNEPLDQATKELIANLQRQNADLQASDGPQAITVNGVEGCSVTLKGQSPVTQNGQPQAERDWLIALPQSNGGQLLYVVFVSPEPDFERLRPTFEKMLRSLHLQ